MIIIPKENRPSLSINLENYREIEDALSSSCGATEGDSNREIPVVTTLDQLSEVQETAKRMKAAKQKAYSSFRNQFLEIDNFIQSSMASNKKAVVHAYCREWIDNDKKQKEIILYTRPRSTNLIVRFFDWVLYSEQEDLAQKFLLKSLACAQMRKPSNFSQNKEGRANIKQIPDIAAISLEAMKRIRQYSPANENLARVNYASGYFLEAAKAYKKQIEQEKREREEENRRMISCIAFEDDFFEWNLNYGNEDIAEAQNEIPELPQALKKFGTEQINSFNEFIRDIKKLSPGPVGAERTSEFSKFCITWVSCFDRKDRKGDEFRHAINKSSQLRAWNVAAHYIALRDHPYVTENEANAISVVIEPNAASQRYNAPFNPSVMNLTHYDKTAHIMISPLNEIYFQERTEQAIIREVITIDEKIPKGYKSIQCSDQVLKSCRPLNISDDLNPEQEAELFSVYQEFINTAVAEKREIVLTPIFNYTENAIDRCIDAMITPIITQGAIGAERPEIRFFSSDPRITEKFNLAIAAPENYMKSRADKAAKVAKATANHGLSQLQLQYGIVPRDMKDPGMIMLHASALRYGEISGTAKILGGFTKKPLFTEAASTGTAVPRKIKLKLATDGPHTWQPANTTGHTKPVSVAMSEKEVMSTTHFIMPTVELHLDPSYYQTLSNLLGLETLSSEQADRIRQTYSRVFKNAKEKGVSNLVLIPCFDLKQRDSLQEQACAVMLDVLDKLLLLHPAVTVKMALASQEEYVFLQQQVARWKKAGNESRRRGI